MHTVADLLDARISEPIIWIEPLASVYDALKVMNEQELRESVRSAVSAIA